MNVCNEGGPIVVFREPPESRLAPDEQRPALRVDDIRRREFAERAAAKQATSNRARAAHQELAQAYARMINQAVTAK